MSTWRMRLLGAAIWLVAGLVAAPAGANLLVNPGFETGDTTGWTPSDVSLAHVVDGSIQPDVVHDGSFGGVLDSYLFAPGDDASLQQSVVLPGPGTYAFGGWLRAFTVESPAGVFDQIQISTWVSVTSEGGSLGDSVGNFTNFQPVDVGSLNYASDWALYSGTFTYTGAGGDIVLFNFNLQNAYNDAISVAAGDSFFLQEVPEPATLSLLGSGLIAIRLAARRRKAV